MADWKKLQQDIYQNKVDHGFNVTDVREEFCLIYGELAEAYAAYDKKKPDLGEELADVAIYLLGMAEILRVDLEAEILRKMEINRTRCYEMVDGVRTRVDTEHGGTGQ